jgi:ribosomal protein S18 acetylase RimI-like enzyme
MLIQIREATPDDRDIVVRFNAALAAETEDKMLDDATLRAGVERALADPERSRYFLAETGGQPVGQLMFTLEWSDWRDGWFWWIQSVYVAPEHRSRGVFSRLYRHLVALARQRSDVCGVRLYVDADNGHAQRVYARLGMAMTGYRVMELAFGEGA